METAVVLYPCTASLDTNCSAANFSMPDPVSESTVSQYLKLKDIFTSRGNAGGTTCALLQGLDSLKCWGYNANGQLGLGDTNNRGDGPDEMGYLLSFVDTGSQTRVITASVGMLHVCALLNTSTLKCWGDNQYGQLGISNSINRGDESGEMGDALEFVNVGTGRTVVSVSSGSHHTCALLDNSNVKCWGMNQFGQLGQGNALTLGDNAGEMGDFLQPVSLGTGRSAREVACGGNYACATLDNGKVKCWGSNNNGQLGQCSTVDTITMGDGLPYTDLGMGLLTRNVSLGMHFACAIIMSNSMLKCWGANQYGQLGLNDTSGRGDSALEMGSALPYVNLGTGRTVKQVSCGYYHACAILDNSKVGRYNLLYYT
jgi:alpha-tubulin suppressor-like RCC1 family protein